MTLIDDTFDCCGKRFDPMGGVLLTKHPEIGPYAVFCTTCEAEAAIAKHRGHDLSAAPVHDLLERYVAAVDSSKFWAARVAPQTSSDFRELAEQIAAEIEGRCVR